MDIYSENKTANLNLCILQKEIDLMTLNKPFSNLAR